MSICQVTESRSLQVDCKIFSTYIQSRYTSTRIKKIFLQFHDIYFGKKQFKLMYPDNSLGKPKDDDNRKSEMTKIKKDMDVVDKIFFKELSSKYFLLDKFSTDQLKDMCKNLLGKGPDIEYYEDKTTKKRMELPQYKEDYIYFIIEEFRFSEIKNYALERHIVTNQFFEK